MKETQLKTLSLEDYRFLEDKDTRGAYDPQTLRRLANILEILTEAGNNRSRPENKLYDKFRAAELGCLLPQNTRTRGPLHFNGALVRLEGDFAGEIRCPHAVHIGKTGRLAGNVVTGRLTCEGVIKGNIVAVKKMHILSTGKVLGDIATPALNIDEGAKFKGKCQMTLNLEKLR